MMIKTIIYKRPKLYDRQTECFFNDKRFSFVEGSTKSGKTVSCMAWLVERAIIHGFNGSNHWWVAPVYPQAKIAFRRIKRGLPKDFYKANETELTLTILASGAVISFKSAEKPDNLYGEDVHDVVVDEASRCREESYHAIRSTLTKTRGRMRAIGNVKGRTNWFYKLCRMAESGDKSMFYGKITAAHAIAAGVLEQEEIDEAKKQLPEAVFNELYYCIPSDDGGNPFGLKSIEACIKPISSLKPVCYGIDLAKSHDFTVIIGLDRNGDVCYYDRFQKTWLETIKWIRHIVKNTPATVDSTGVGDPVLEHLQEGGYTNYIGYKFSSSTKQVLMEGLTVAIQQRKIGYPDNEIRKELDIFEYQYTRTGVKYTAPEGLHDDCVMSLALANHGLNHKPIEAQIIL